MATQIKPQNAGGLERKFNSAGFPLFLASSKIILNGHPETVVFPKGAEYFIRRGPMDVKGGAIYPFEFFSTPGADGSVDYRLGEHIEANVMYKRPDGLEMLKIKLDYSQYEV